MATKGCSGETLRIVLLGKTGAGKSSLGNALTGKKAPKTGPKDQRDEKPPEHKDPELGFKVGRGLRSETVFCDWNRGEREGTILEVTDTPGLCDTHLPEQAIYKEVAKSVAVAEPGPNVIIFALRCDRRFTKEEYDAYNKIKQLFSEEMNKYLILVFNGLDVFDDGDSLQEQRQTLECEILKFGNELKDMVKQADNRFFGMNNKAPASEKDEQIRDLVRMMQDLVRKNGKDVYFKTEMTEEIMRKVEAMADEEAEAKGISRSQATTDVKKDIVSERVKPIVFSSFIDVVARSAAWIHEGIANMCSVM